MEMNFQEIYPTEPPIVFGRTLSGKALEEYPWGDRDKSILFLSGFTPQDRPLSEMLFRFRHHLAEGEYYGGILGDFDLKILKNKCKIRLIPVLNPDAFNINQNGLIENQNLLKNSTKHSLMHTNARGIDLNRNFNANWIKMRTADPQRTDLGPFPESEPEVRALTARIRQNPPAGAVLLRWGERALHYPEKATPKELREAVFLGQYASLPVSPAQDTDGTALQWLTDRGIKTVELRLPEEDQKNYLKLRDLLTMCAALT